MTTNWEKFKLLLWKNWRIQLLRHKQQLFFLIIMPLFFVSLLAILRAKVPISSFPKPIRFPPVKIQFTSKPVTNWEVAYYPKISKCLNEIVVYVENWLKNNNNLNENVQFKLIGYDTKDQLNLRVQYHEIIAAVEFDESFVNAVQCPKKISYSIRFQNQLKESEIPKTWQTGKLNSNIFGALRIGHRSNVDSKPSYFNEGFIGIQHAFAMAFINNSNEGEIKVPEINIQKFPYPPHNLDYLFYILDPTVSFLILLSFLFPSMQIVKYVAIEKKTKLKEVMKIMGLPNWLQLTAWFVTSYLMITIVVIVIVYVLKLKLRPNVAVLPNCNGLILLIFFLTYCISLVALCFLVGAFFSKANAATASAAVLWFATYLPYLMFQPQSSNLSSSAILFLSIFSNTALGFAFNIILTLEGTGEGLQWKNLFLPVTSENYISIGLIIIILIIDSILYMVMVLYVEKILSSEYGIQRKWYFPFMKLANDLRLFKKKHEDYNYNGYVMSTDQSAFEPGPKNKKVGISIKNFWKKLGDKTVVNGLSMNLYEDEILALLGHNGAGKTTIISMITGIIPPSNGTVLLNGYDVRKDLENARKSLGFCPQYDILFDELTVREHIKFFSRLKGLDRCEVEFEIQKYLKLLQLENKANVQSQKLSGGMKRKLSVALALCGGSAVVLCDEPTSGMDPESRRAFWDLLEVERRGRTILISTHFMDEADVLGDRIAIMSNGELQTYGTSFFLKKRFGSGYHLVCVKYTGCQSTEVSVVLRQFIPDIVVEKETHTEISYILKDTYANLFEKLLLELENRSSELKINSFGLTQTTLEEVFMQVCTDTDVDKKDILKRNREMKNKKTEKSVTIYLGKDSTGESNHFLTGWKLMLSQWKAMFLKKYLYAERNYIILVIQNVLPVILVIANLLSNKKHNQPLQLNIGKYSKTVTVLELNGLSKIASEYKKYIQSFGRHHKFIEIKESFEDYVLKLQEKNLAQVNFNYIIGSTIASETSTAWFNPQSLHSLPMALNTIHNAILRSVTSDSSSLIEVENKPYPKSIRQQIESGETNTVLQLTMNLAFCFSFVTAIYILFQIKERVSHAKLLQFVSGVDAFIFWASQFIFDIGTFLITAILTIMTIACFQNIGLSTANDLGRIFLIFILFGFSSLAVTSLFAFFFTESASGFARMSILNCFTGPVFYMFLQIFRGFGKDALVSSLHSIFSIFPHYFFANSIANVISISQKNTLCLKLADIYNIEPNMDVLCKEYPSMCCVPDYFAWEQPGIGSNIFRIIIVFFVTWMILMIIEYRLLHGLVLRIQRFTYEMFFKPDFQINASDTINDDNDDDVKKEELMVQKMSRKKIRKNNLVLNRITKYYWRFLAVDNISLAVKRSECFGLLGVNGAGKTTSFKMMVGEENITYGDVYVRGFSINRKLIAVRKRIGYCPQTDALLEDLTGREILRMFALLCGIPKNFIEAVSEDLSEGLGFTKYMDKQVKNYSGGNKRKLSVSIALISCPSLIFLDEPTTGMDPGAKRKLWNQINKRRTTGRSIILTSHSMEECEALCTRLTIMVNGRFHCLGSKQYLKNKFSQGVVVKLKISKNEGNERNKSSRRRHGTTDTHVGNVINFIKNNFKDAKLKEKYQGLLTFHIPNKSVRWSKIFGIIEENKVEFNIEDYSVSETTLEDIFLVFSKLQLQDRRIHR